MSHSTYDHALTLLRQALDDPTATFHSGQWQAIEQLVAQRVRLLVVQRTGWGKSLVYFLATRLLRDQGAGPTLLISPLLALMRNQILAAKRIGVRAETVNSSNTEEWNTIRGRLLANQIDILLISPERLANDTFRNTYLMPIARRIGLLVVDEAHCISDWGHDFRPDYRRIVRVLQALPANIPVLTTTATANDRVVNDIVSQLGVGVEVLRGSLVRDSLALQNIHLPDQAARLAWLAEHVPQLPGSGIIYTLTVRDAQRVADWLQTQGIAVAAYYGDVANELREDLEQRLLQNQIKALVATSALGMGFDKPDLGFVIHFQRPGSVIHYYQQVGRAGRAIERAYGIMLSGDEDDEISDYFIRTAFPPAAHVADVLALLDAAENGLTIPQLESKLNIRHSQIEKVLKLLLVETPSPVSKRGTCWFANPIDYVPNQAKVEQLTRLRRVEQDRMRDYLHSRECLMRFLSHELDDPTDQPCGRCAVCVGHPLISESYADELAIQAAGFLRRLDQVIEPRKLWPSDTLVTAHGWRGRISLNLQAEEGRALCLWGDAGWGTLVKRGKQVDGHFDDALVQAMTDLIRVRWQPTPTPTWITCVPSGNHPGLVRDVAQRLADTLRIPFVPVVRRVRATAPQKTMQNSAQQARNLAGAFVVDPWPRMAGPVLLVDDMVDSQWTFTIIAALLRAAGSGPVFPVALAQVLS